MANFLYVDNSNVWIEGMRASAVAKGLAANIHDAMQHNITDRDWRLDFGKLHDFAGRNRPGIGRAVLYGSRPPANDSLWILAKKDGFDVVVHDRNIANREKKVDTSMVTDMVADSYELMKPATDEITLISGDRDLQPAVEQLVKRGFRVDVVFWDHAAIELKNCATRFVSLNPHLRILAR
jgi:hypothetical protein